MTSPETKLQPDPKAIVGSLIGGALFVIAPTWLNAAAFGTPAVPLIGMVTGFLLAGIVTGYLSEQETVAEPYIGAIVTAVAAYFVFANAGLPSFTDVGAAFEPVFILTSVNGLVATLAGAWTGEKLQRTYYQEASRLAWGWIMAGAVLGIGLVLFFLAPLVWMFGLFSGPEMAIAPSKVWVLLIALALGTGGSGFFSAYRSPGDTAGETIISGLVTATLLFDLFYFGLGGRTMVSSLGLAMALGTSLVASLVGGLFGEAAQDRTERLARQQAAAAKGQQRPTSTGA
jgi:hypothetical protein